MYKSFVKSHHLELNNDLELFAKLLQTPCSMEKMIPIAQRICQPPQVMLLSTEQADYVIKYHLNRFPFIKHHYFAPVEPTKKKSLENKKKKKKPKKTVPNTNLNGVKAILATAALIAASAGGVEADSHVAVRSTDANTQSLPILDHNRAVHHCRVPNIDIPNADDVKNPMVKVKGWWGYEGTELINSVYNCVNPSGLEEIYQMLKYYPIYQMLKCYKDTVQILERDSDNLNALDYIFVKLKSWGTRSIGYSLLDYFLPYLNQEAFANVFNYVAGITETDYSLKKQNDELLDQIISLEKKYKPFLYKRYVQSIRDNDVTMFNRLHGQPVILNEEENPNGWSPLHYAIESWDDTLYAHWENRPSRYKMGENMQQILRKLLSWNDTIDQKGWTPLLMAAAQHKYGAIEILLENGAKILDTQNDDGDTALKMIQNNYPMDMMAAEGTIAYNPDVVSPNKLMRNLIDNGANPNVQNDQGISAYMLCQRQHNTLKYIKTSNRKSGTLSETENKLLMTSINQLRNLLKYYTNSKHELLHNESKLSAEAQKKIDQILRDARDPTIQLVLAQLNNYSLI